MERLRPLLHIDPVAVLPPEITSEIFSYLTPSMLLEASRASKAWRESTLDSRLWKQNFSQEGWGLDMDQVRTFEQKYSMSRMNGVCRENLQGAQRSQKKRSRAEVDGADDGSSSRQPRGTPVQSNGIQAWNERPANEELETRNSLFNSGSNQDEEMHDIFPDAAIPKSIIGSSTPAETQPMSFSNDEDVNPEKSEWAQSAETLQNPDGISDTEESEQLGRDQEMMIHTTSGNSRLNYHYVFKQKRKLEDNWNAGSFKSFQLPHRDHPKEAHRECVYTIQYIGKYLVSGSRDRTLRIWDLDTQRLVRKPLIGHTASVLCLQFDSRESEDIIISGSSDTDVILWRFSTGKMLRKISQAHRESVLNLKFDHRFLVTCSKDKTIKIWSRHELRPGDADYPVKGVLNGGKCPSYILDLTNIGSSIDLDTFLTPEQRKPLKPYTPLMLIDSHGAAVNAIYIYQDRLVSASGDRYVKVFDIHTGVCTATCRGHTKGIACVQYDGKRIVCGSSDNTIRIYDPATEAEVACLQGHSRLVRTIQSAFGDVPSSSREQLEMEANAIDEQFFAATRSGKVPTGPSPRNRDRNSGSKLPKDIMAIGAKLPPGGGGSRWGRIVSGSYDETIIIWKKVADGRWVMGHRLRQEEALRAAGGPLVSQSDLQSQQSHTSALQHGHGHNPQPNHALAPAHVPGVASAPQFLHSGAPNGSAAFQAVAHGTAHVGSHPSTAVSAQLLAYQQLLQQQMAASAAGPSVSSATATTNGATVNPHTGLSTASHLPMYQQQHIAGLVANSQNMTQATSQQHVPQSSTGPPQPPSSFQAPGSSQAGPSQASAAPPSMLVYGQPVLLNQAAAAAAVSQPNARVFKLQFDARRIICCSQDPKIVGWDFANGDEKIIECSRFFSTPQ